MDAVALINSRSGERIAATTELALTRSARRRGLLQRTGLDAGHALVLAPCLAIHTAFMRFSIDVMFVDRAGYVRRIVRHLPPWRAVASPRAYATVEFAAGALDFLDVAVGDRVYLDAGSLWPAAAIRPDEAQRRFGQPEALEGR